MSLNKVGLLVVAGGRGLRLGADRPKQYLSCAGRPLIAHTLEALATGFPFSAVTVVIRAEDRALYNQAVAHLTETATAALGQPAIGGATRQQSVLAGLEALAAAEPDIVLIHDAVRPFPSPDLIARAVEAAVRHGAAAPGTAMSDTVKEVDADGRVLATPPRSALRAVQTPQAFRFPLILAAHRRAADAGV
ncbi:MAG TPA: IspD/TarI family cytidylyltransferase, partial [Roseiarcus sp.]|nr:IspD/TarI family cytidylyltransferase [Roseiarcus sp.]